MNPRSFPALILPAMLLASCQPAQRQASDGPDKVDTVSTVRDSAEIRAFEEQTQLETARRDSVRDALERTRIIYDDKGRYVVQLSAWRSREHAESQAAMWRGRGFNSMYVEETGDESTGDLWYRVRIGRFGDREMADRVRGVLASEHGATSWIGIWEGGS